jgi:hypothetical protein
MELEIPQALVRWRGAPRLIPSRYPVVGLFDRVASAADLSALFELEGWTNDRITAEAGVLSAIPPDEWVTGRPMASVVMAAFCHPRPEGSRFSGPNRGAWYAARTLDAALAESTYHRTEELREVGGFDTRVEMRVYSADFAARFHDARPIDDGHRIYHRADYSASQRLGRELLSAGSNGLVYKSVRRPGGACIACFRPRLVKNVRAAGHYEFRWEGRPDPVVRRL